jgi:uncharacterized protein YjbI with pentapeptide repeats
LIPLRLGWAIVLAALALGGPAAAQAPPPAEDAPTFWDVVPGMHAAELPRGFADYACGTNGGPPARPLSGWMDYATCRPEAGTGLHEVQFRYDDEPEFIARAHRNDMQIAATEGTQIFIVPVIVSALFDDDGFVVGIRAVTDPRVSDEVRLRAISLQNFIKSYLDPDGWLCEMLPPGEGETAHGALFVKERCTKSLDGSELSLESHYYRKRGQRGLDLAGAPLAGQFRSDVRFEMMLAGPIPERAARLADIAAHPLQPTEAELNRERALVCPGCELAGIDLKRQNLTGANLAGANLAGANLHGAILANADLTGADLTGANLNKATLTLARLSGARLSEAMLFAAALDGADLSGADLTKAMMGEARLTRASLEGARVVAVDLTRARLSEANLRDAALGGTWLTEAQMVRANLSGANLLQAIVANAVLTEADLSGAVIHGADFFGADLRRANLAGADFTGSRLQSALLTGANREGAVFTDVFGMPR